MIRRSGSDVTCRSEKDRLNNIGITCLGCHLHDSHSAGKSTQPPSSYQGTTTNHAGILLQPRIPPNRTQGHSCEKALTAGRKRL